MRDWASIYEENFYEKPKPSLCDTCKNAGYIRGGSAGIGAVSYRQRYCSVYHIAIHQSGRLECEGYMPVES